MLYKVPSRLDSTYKISKMGNNAKNKMEHGTKKTSNIQKFFIIRSVLLYRNK